jgi:hypothetical protein
MKKRPMWTKERIPRPYCNTVEGFFLFVLSAISFLCRNLVGNKDIVAYLGRKRKSGIC